MKRRIVKVGGSLLSIKRLGQKLNHWLVTHADMQNVIVIGGGRIVDIVRELEESQYLDAELAHETACRSMSLTALIFRGKIDGCEHCDQFEKLDQIASANVIFDTAKWILSEPDVPATWDFTSDSIAARLTVKLSADELVLIKSRMGDLDEHGFVDAYFAKESASIERIRVCTLE